MNDEQLNAIRARVDVAQCNDAFTPELAMANEQVARSVRAFRAVVVDARALLEHIAALEAENARNEKRAQQWKSAFNALRDESTRLNEQGKKYARFMAGGNDERVLDELVRTIEQLEAENARLREACDSAGDWIAGADVRVEPGWAGSTSHILGKLTAARAALNPHE
jgi:predicted RNase H-like nuclease (RuvC/YqgF family)